MIVRPRSRFYHHRPPAPVLDDPLPETLHDFSVDLIVTPDEVIECSRQRRPTGLDWSHLTAAQIAAIPVLAKQVP